MTGDGTLVLTLTFDPYGEHRRWRHRGVSVVKVPGIAQGAQLKELYQSLLNLVFLLRGNPIVKGIIQ
jgi:hypothetical protein